MTCFYCGKFGQMSRDCRARIADDNTYKQTPAGGSHGKTPAAPTGASDRKETHRLLCMPPGGAHVSPVSQKTIG